MEQSPAVLRIPVYNEDRSGIVIRKLTLKNFRKYAFHELTFDRGMNIIGGENGIGKTSLMSAIELLLSISDTAGSRKFLKQCEEVFRRSEVGTTGAISSSIEACFVGASGSESTNEHKFSVESLHNKDGNGELSFTWDSKASTIEEIGAELRKLVSSWPCFVSLSSTEISRSLRACGNKRSFFTSHVKALLLYEDWNQFADQYMDCRSRALTSIDAISSGVESVRKENEATEGQVQQEIRSKQRAADVINQILSHRFPQAGQERNRGDRRRELLDEIESLKNELKAISDRRKEAAKVVRSEMDQKKMRLKHLELIEIQNEIREKENAVDKSYAHQQELDLMVKRMALHQDYIENQSQRISELESAHKETKNDLAISEESIHELKLKLQSLPEFTDTETAARKLESEIDNLKASIDTLDKQLARLMPIRERWLRELMDSGERICSIEQEEKESQERMLVNEAKLGSLKSNLLRLKSELDMVIFNSSLTTTASGGFAKFAKSFGLNFTLIYDNYESIIEEMNSLGGLNPDGSSKFHGMILEHLTPHTSCKTALRPIMAVLKIFVVQDYETAFILKKVLERRQLAAGSIVTICLDDYDDARSDRREDPMLQTAAKLDKSGQSVSIKSYLKFRADSPMNATTNGEILEAFLGEELRRYRMVPPGSQNEIGLASQLAIQNPGFYFITSQGYRVSAYEVEIGGRDGKEDVFAVFEKMKTRLASRSKSTKLKSDITSVQSEILKLREKLESEKEKVTSLRSELQDLKSGRSSLERRLRQVDEMIGVPRSQMQDAMKQLEVKEGFLREIRERRREHTEDSAEGLIAMIVQEQTRSNDLLPKVRQLERELRVESQALVQRKKLLDDLKIELSALQSSHSHGAHEQRTTNLASLRERLQIVSNEFDELSIVPGQAEERDLIEELNRAQLAKKLERELSKKEKELRKLRKAAELGSKLSTADLSRLRAVGVQMLENGNLDESLELVESQIARLSRISRTNREMRKANEQLCEDLGEVAESYTEIWGMLAGVALRFQIETSIVRTLEEGFTRRFRLFQKELGSAELVLHHLVDSGSASSRVKQSGIEREHSERPKSLLDGLEVDAKARFDGGSAFVPLSHLSGGQKHVLILAMTMATCDIMEPGFILLDEVDESLDKYNCDVLNSILREESKRSQVFFVSHKPLSLIGDDDEHKKKP